MSPDDIDSLIYAISTWIDANGIPIYESGMDDDVLYDQLSEVCYKHLEPFCTRDRNYN